jgi:hypothetical protein
VAFCHPPPPRADDRTSWRKRIHTHLTSTALAEAEDNSILGAPTPLNNPEELSLPREDGVLLSRFRCGHDPHLQSNKGRINPSTDASCRWCPALEEDMTHIMSSCIGLQHLRTAMGITSPRDLWEAPVKSAAFLKSAGIT